ncbi:NUDIX hydrolase [Neoaquamicrobium microcysteis]|nr:NUDIX domain-containing protein [Mesorhizobium microcysteis]
MSTTSPIRLASTIMLVREQPVFEVLMVRRHHQIDFMSGAMVFPGGKVEEHDLDPRWAESAIGWNDVAEIERGPRIAAIREAFEESGMLPGCVAPPADREGSAHARAAMENGTLAFIDYVRQHEVTLDLRMLTLFSRWLTPPVVPKRFDTFFYVASAPAGEAVADGRETVDTEWLAPADALRLAAEGHRTIVFPTRMNLGLLATTRTLAGAVAAAKARSGRTIQPRVEQRGSDRYIMLDPEAGYGHVEELLSIP